MKLHNYITAFWLIVYLPKLLYLWLKENKKMVSIALVCLFIMFVLSFAFGSKETTGSTQESGTVDIVDLTPAFSTGEKRTLDVEVIAIHHTAGNPNAGIHQIILKHYIENGWKKIGYHFFIAKDGTIYQLRPLNERVPHAYGCNDNAIAICLAGNFSQYECPKTQWDAAKKLTRSLMVQYNVTKDHVLKHSELTKYSPLNRTECAGKLFNMDKFREEL